MKYTQNIPKGMNVFVQGSGGLAAGVDGAKVKTDFLSAGLKIKKNHDGSVEIEVAGQLGVTVGGEAGLSGEAGAGLRAGASVKIKEDGTLVFGQKIGAGASGGGGGKTPTGVSAFGKYGVDVSAMGGWELEMSAEAYARLTPWQKSWMSNPAYAAYLAKTNEDIGLYITTEIKTSHGGSTGVSGGGGWGPGGSVEGGVGWESEGTNHVPDGWDRIKLLWYWQNGHYILVTIHYDQPEVMI
jgi:hypothetical protein